LERAAQRKKFNQNPKKESKGSRRKKIESKSEKGKQGPTQGCRANYGVVMNTKINLIVN
jgi:hypothetical protein